MEKIKKIRYNVPICLMDNYVKEEVDIWLKQLPFLTRRVA